MGLKGTSLERRVGVLGDGRSRILNQLIAAVPGPAPETAGLQPGLSADRLQRLAAQGRFSDLGEAFPTRGGTGRIGLIAWFGSLVADIGCAPTFRHRDLVLREGALFNLAVALFDTIIDDQPSRRRAAAEALRPEVLIAVLRGGVPLPNHGDTALNSLVGLFNSTLLSTHRRLCRSPGTLSELGELLSRMYRSELGIDRDRFAAKILPVVYIGRLGDLADSPAVRDLYTRLSKFIALWDDWNDLADDILAGRPNWFAGDGSGWSIRNVARPSWRVLGGRFSHAQIARTLRVVMEDTVTESRSAPNFSGAVTLFLLRVLLGLEQVQESEAEDGSARC